MILEVHQIITNHNVSKFIILIFEWVEVTSICIVFYLEDLGRGNEGAWMEQEISLLQIITKITN